MDIEKPFTFFTEDKRSHLELIIPGHPTQKSWKVRWDKNLEHDFRAIKKEERAQVVRYYQEHGFLNGYDKKTLEDMRIGGRGWIISYPWNVRTDNPAYVRIFEHSAYWELVERLWRPMFFTLSENKDLYPFTEYTVPVLPRIVTTSFVDKWYQTNQAEASYLERVQKKSEQTHIIPQQEGNKIILKIKDHPFVSQPVERILLYPSFPKNFPQRISHEAQEFLRKKLLRRDAYRLKGLSDNERIRLTHLQSTATQNDYRIHWTRWLSFHGDMSASNAILVSRDTEIKYQTLVQRPFDIYWEKNWSRLAQTGQKIYADIPIPMLAYRPTPIPPVRTKRQNRYRLNRLAQQAANEYQYED